MNLDQALKPHGYNISKASVYYLGIEVLKLLEAIHDKGYVHKDLKFSNLLVSYRQAIDLRAINCFQNVDINLIDFGFAKSFIGKDG